MAMAAINVRYVLIKLFTTLTGYTDKAVRRKIEEGIWVEGIHYKKSPDGHIQIDMEGYNKWVEGENSSGLKPANRQ